MLDYCVAHAFNKIRFLLTGSPRAPDTRDSDNYEKGPPGARKTKRLEKYRDELFTFLSHPEIPAANNRGGREVRFAVLIRKIMYGNRGGQGAIIQGVLMTVFPS